MLSITSHPKGVKTLAVSDTLGDIVSVSPRGMTSNGKGCTSDRSTRLLLYTLMQSF